MNTPPKISVCIPTYNYGRFIAQAIESVLSQDYIDYELLVIDDCSTDDSVAIASFYAEQDSRVRLIVNEANIGMVANWNLCIESSKGEYIRFLFADDFLTDRSSLGLMAKVLDRYPFVALVGSARRFVDENSLESRIVSHFPDYSLNRGREAIRRALLEERNLFGEPSAVMFRRVNAVRGFSTSYRQLVDLEMWLHLLTTGDYFHFAAPYVAFREHPAQQTVANLSKGGLLSDELLRLSVDYGRRSEHLGKFWCWYLSCQHGIRRRRWRQDADGSTIPGPITIFIVKLLKPFLKIWCRGRSSALKQTSLSEN